MIEVIKLKKILSILLLFILSIFLFSCNNNQNDNENTTINFKEYIKIEDRTITYDGENHTINPKALKELPSQYELIALTNTVHKEPGAHDIVYLIVDKDDNSKIYDILKATLTIEKEEEAVKEIYPNEDETGLNYQYKLAYNKLSQSGYLYTYDDALIATLGKQAYEIDANGIVKIIKEFINSQKKTEEPVTVNLDPNEEVLVDLNDNSLEDYYNAYLKLIALISKLAKFDLKQYIIEDEMNYHLDNKIYDDFSAIIDDLDSELKTKINNILNVLKEYDSNLLLNEDKQLEELSLYKLVDEEEKEGLNLKLDYLNGIINGLQFNIDLDELLFIFNMNKELLEIKIEDEDTYLNLIFDLKNKNYSLETKDLKQENSKLNQFNLSITDNTYHFIQKEDDDAIIDLSLTLDKEANSATLNGMYLDYSVNSTLSYIKDEETDNTRIEGPITLTNGEEENSYQLSLVFNEKSTKQEIILNIRDNDNQNIFAFELAFGLDNKEDSSSLIFNFQLESKSIRSGLNFSITKKANKSGLSILGGYLDNQNSIEFSFSNFDNIPLIYAKVNDLLSFNYQDKDNFEFEIKYQKYNLSFIRNKKDDVITNKATINFVLKEKDASGEIVEAEHSLGFDLNQSTMNIKITLDSNISLELKPSATGVVPESVRKYYMNRQPASNLIQMLTSIFS